MPVKVWAPLVAFWSCTEVPKSAVRTTEEVSVSIQSVTQCQWSVKGAPILGCPVFVSRTLAAFMSL